MMFDLVSDFLDRVKWFGLRKIYYTGKHLLVRIEDILIDNAFIHPLSTSAFVKRRISRTLIELYNGHEGQNANAKNLFIGFGLIHYAFIRNLRPKNILCIGSQKGYIPAILALACKDNGFGHVDFVDAGYDKHNVKEQWGGIGFWKHIDPQKHFARVGAKKYIHTYVMTSKAYAKLFPRKKYQYIYIDGDHSYEGVKLDYTLFWPKLDTYGFMAFHDTIVHGYIGKGKFGVWKLWKEISQKHSIIFPFPKDSGFGLLQKK